MSKEKTAHPMNRPGHGPMGAGHSIVKAKDFPVR